MSFADELFTSATEKTFQYDDSLPSLPLPSLHSTLEKYLESVKPFVTKEEYANTEKIVKEFENGVGKSLHDILHTRARNMRNWVERWWLEYAYLYQRTPLIPTSSMGGIFPCEDPLWAPNRFDPSSRAALMIYFVLQFWKLIRKEQLRPHLFKGQAWTMNQFRSLFGTMRIPGILCDKLISKFTTESEGPIHSNYIIVMCKGRIFKMEVLDSQNEPINPPELKAQFQYINNKCRQEPWGQNIASLTCDDRTEWAKNREWLINFHEENKKTIEIIENAIKFLSFDEGSPKNNSQLLHEIIGGDIRNRWSGGYNTVIFNNGTTASLADHTPCDGMVGVAVGYYARLKIEECDGIWEGNQNVRPMSQPTELIFNLDASISPIIDNVISVTSAMIQNVVCLVESFSSFGKTYISSIKQKPDTVIQMALQLGYYRLHKSNAPTYETASTRAFFHGRTETVRSCTMESVNWVKSMLDPSCSQDKQLALFQTASEKHNKLMQEAQNNEGCDRHFLGLYAISVENDMPTPEIFLDPTWIKSGGNGNYILSTSFAGYLNASGGVVPMCQDGYGVFYSMRDDVVTFTMTTFKDSDVTDINGLYNSIARSLEDIQRLFLKASL